MPNVLPFAGRTQTSLLHVLMYSPVAMSLDEIAIQIGVTKTAARQHILNLQRSGYVQVVEPELEHKKRRGRPTITYEISREGRELFARQYALFSEKMILMLKDGLDEEQFKKKMQSLGKSLAEDLQHKMPKPRPGKLPGPETMEALANLMQEVGYDAYQSADNEITAHNCVFHKLAEKYETVCEVDLTLVQKLTGKKPVHTECMVRGGKVCRFTF
jgi:predicted ArsR family transcriptional regulator